MPPKPPAAASKQTTNSAAAAPTPPTAIQPSSKRSAASRLLGSKGAAPAPSAIPAAFADIVPHADSTGPQRKQSKSNDVTIGPRHFRRTDTWRGDV